MIKEINVAGIKLNNYSVHEQLMQVEKNMVENVFTSIEDIYMRTLLYAKEDEIVKSEIESMGITVIADAEILEAAEASTILGKREIETREFFFQLMKRVERNGMSVFIVGDSHKDALVALEYLREEFPRMILKGYRLMDESIASHENVINEINMIAPDVIVSVLPSPDQEHFLADHKGMISAKIWYGLGRGKIDGQKHSLSTMFWKKFRLYKLKKYSNLDKE